MSTKIPHVPYTTLGIAARSSTRNAMGCRKARGANSVSKIATPSASGTAISRANNDDASVPKIMGAAPYTSATGSQVDVQRKEGPKRRSAGRALTNSTPRMTTIRSGSASASSVSTSLYMRSLRSAPLSACHSVETLDLWAGGAGRGSSGSERIGRLRRRFSSHCAGGSPDRLQAGLNPGPQLLGQWGVAELDRLRLAIVLHPPDELHQRAGLRGIAIGLVDEQPREARCGIRLRARRVGDGHPEVGVRSHVLHRARGGCRDRFERRRNPVAGAVAQRAKRDLVGDGIAQLDVSNGARRLPHGGRDAFVAAAAESHRPVHRRTLADFLLPLGADFGEVVGPHE